MSKHLLIKNSMNIQMVCTFSLILFFGLSLSGCTGMNSSFDCNQIDGKGLGCVSMQSVNQQANEGRFYSNDANQLNLDKNQQSKENETQSAKLPQGLNVSAPQPGDPVRFAETIQQIWIAPYEDKTGNYHEPSLIYTVIYPPHWVGIPAKTVREDEED